MSSKFYYGEDDLVSYALAFSEGENIVTVSNSSGYKHTKATIGGERIDFIWFKERNAG